MAHQQQYNWEKDLLPYTTTGCIENLRQVVNNKIRKGKISKWLIIIADVLFIGLMILLIGRLNILQMGVDQRGSLITGIIAFELAVVTFLSPIKTSTITDKEVDRIVGIAVTADIMQKIQKTVDKKTSEIQKWLAIIGACGIFAALILKLIS